MIASAGHHVSGHLHGGHGADDMVLMSLIACGVSYAMLDAACRIRAAHGRARVVWLVAGSLVVGLGIWAMHFVALLSLRLPLPMVQDPVTIGIGAVTAVMAAAGALHHFNRGVMGVSPLVVGAGLKAFALVATHYTTVASVHIPATIEYHPPQLAFSVLLAMSVALAGMMFAEQLRAERPAKAAAERLVAALLMGGGLVLMHHVSMNAGHFIPDDIWAKHAQGHHLHSLSAAWLMPWLTGIALACFAALAAASSVSRWRQHRHGLSPATDALTGLPNGARLRERLTQDLLGGQTCTVIAVRLERFEVLTHRLGRREAERLLARLGQRLQRAARPGDLVARLGRVEYAILVPEGPEGGDGPQVAARVREWLSAPVSVGQMDIIVPAAVGLATDGPDADPRDMLARAQLAAARATRTTVVAVSALTPPPTAQRRPHLELDIVSPLPATA